MTAYVQATWNDSPDDMVYIEAVHRLSNLGAVVTDRTTGISKQGFEAEWRIVHLYTFEDNLFNRCEVFDEADLDAALARFDELSQPAPRRLHNAASETNARFDVYFAAREWVSMGQLLTDDTYTDDRRQVVNAGIRRGRDTEIANMRTLAGLGVTEARPWSLQPAASASRFSAHASPAATVAPRHSTPTSSTSSRSTPTTESRRASCSTPTTSTPPFEELDARYLTGEAAAYSDTWSLVIGAYSGLNRRELPATTPDWVDVDHRRGRSFAPGDMIPYIHATWDITPDLSYYAMAVHQLSNLGAVVTRATKGTSREGFYAEWREIALMTFDGELFNRCEMYDEEDLDAALARFDELSRPTPRLENAATRAYDRQRAHFLAGDWDALAEMIAHDHYGDDRRRVVNDEIRRGRDAEMASLRAIADLGVTDLTVVAIAIRGDRLALTRMRGATSGPSWVHTELLRLVEIDEDERISARVVFDLEDIDEAIAELDARYLAGEAAAHAQTWSVIAGVYATFNRREFPAMTTDWVSIDHRPVVSVAAGDMAASIREVLDQRRTYTFISRLFIG